MCPSRVFRSLLAGRDMTIRNKGGMRRSRPHRRQWTVFWINMWPVRVQAQQSTNWCWAATAQALVRFFRGNRIDQATLAGHFLNVPGCTIGMPACDKGHPVEPVMRHHHVHHLTRNSGQPEYVIARNLDNRRIPICVVRWSAGTHHAVVLSGYGIQDNRGVYMVDDPATGVSIVACDDFMHCYQGHGVWVETHYGA